MNKKIRNATLKFLVQMKHWEILEEDFDGFVIALDEDEEVIHFVKPCHSTGTTHDAEIEHTPRAKFEEAMYKFYNEAEDISNVQVVYDACNITVLDNDRGFIRYYHNAPLDD